MLLRKRARTFVGSKRVCVCACVRRIRMDTCNVDGGIAPSSLPATRCSVRGTTPYYYTRIKE